MSSPPKGVITVTTIAYACVTHHDYNIYLQFTLHFVLKAVCMIILTLLDYKIVISNITALL